MNKAALNIQGSVFCEHKPSLAMVMWSGVDARPWVAGLQLWERPCALQWWPRRARRVDLMLTRLASNSQFKAWFGALKEGTSTYSGSLQGIALASHTHSVWPALRAGLESSQVVRRWRGQCMAPDGLCAGREMGSCSDWRIREGHQKKGSLSRDPKGE